MEPHWERLIDGLEHGLVTLDRLAIKKLATTGEPAPLEFLEKAVAPALERIGKRWEDGDLALSQVFMSARLCEKMVETLLPEGAPGRKERPRLALGVLLDHHALGKRIVHSVLRSTGCTVLDYGQGASVESMADRAIEDDVDVLLISVLMHSSALKVRDVRRRLDEKDSRIKIVVGGAPFVFDARLWQDVGADAMGVRASEAPTLVQRVYGGSK